MNLEHLLSTFGYAAVFCFVGIESLGVPFPGETMLITAGIYAGHTQRLSIIGIVAAATAGAVIGDNIGYWIGDKGGYRLLRRYGRYIRLDESRLKVGQYLFLRHGGKVVFFGRFVSILRTYAAFLAGTNRMQWRRFLMFNAAGGIVWAAAWGWAAYALGTTIDKVNKPLDYTFGALGVMGVLAGFYLARRNEARLKASAEEALPGPLRPPGSTGDGERDREDHPSSPEPPTQGEDGTDRFKLAPGKDLGTGAGRG